MDLNFSEEQEMLRRSARDLLKRECPASLVRDMEAHPRGIPLSLWSRMAQTGWLGMPFPERYGGAAKSFLDLTILLEEVGRALVPGPIVQTIVSCGMAILEYGTEAQRRRYLPGIASGNLLMALAWLEPGTRYEEMKTSTRATQRNDGFVLTGVKLFVPYANSADAFLVVARSSGEADSAAGLVLLLVDAHSPGVALQPLKTRARDKQHEVVFENVAVAQGNVLGTVGEGGSILERLRMLSAAAQCAELAGMCGAVTDMAVEYAKNRVQFGRPIGSFQAVQRHCTDMWGDTEGMRLATYEAAWRISAGLPAAKQVGMARSYASDASRRVIESGHQVHGAIGLTEEHNMTLYSRRASAAAVNYGDPQFYREIVAQEMGL